MIMVRAQLTINAAYRGAFLSHLQSFIETSRAETGCLSFGCYEDVTAPNAFTVLEEWHDRETFENHEQSAHLAAFKAKIGGMIVSREPTRVYTINQIGGL